MLGGIMDVNWVILYFVYGQVFFMMGLVTVLQWRRRSHLELARPLPWLAAFGIAHGFNEWGYIFVPLQTVNLPTHVATIVYLAHLLLLAVSFFFMLQFGMELLLPMFPRRRWLRDVPGVVFLLWLGALLLRAVLLGESFDMLLAIGDGWSRYFLNFPGSMLAALGLLRQARQVRERGLPRIAVYMIGAAVAFAVYGVVGGLIVPTAPYPPASILNYDLLVQTIRIPAPVFRSMCGLAILVFVVRFLEVFQAESDRRIEEMEKAQFVAADRERIGRDLHDGTIQNIYAAGLSLEEAQHAIVEDPAWAQEQIEAVMVTLNRTIQDIRSYIFDLYATEQARALNTVLENLTRELQLDTMVKLELQGYDQHCRRLTAEQITHLTQITREALSNVVQHAQATRVVVSLRCENGRLRLTVSDDGVGMPVTTAEHDEYRGEGISNMRARVRLMGGEFALEGAPGQGTRVVVAVPCGVEVAK